jgi:hypothetical protein
VNVGQDADSDATDVAAMHEAMHDRLQFSTIYGGLVLVLSALGDATDDDRWNTRATMMARAYRTVHEEFATWMSITAFGWTVDRLHQQFPLYTRHARSAAGRVATLTDPYLAIHAVQAAARAAMQTAQLAETLTRDGLHTLLAGPIPRSMQPDYRLHRLSRQLAAHGWGPLASADHTATPSLEEFAAARDVAWDDLNAAAYHWCAQLLATDGCPTLPYDGHIPYLQAAAAEAVEVAGGPIGLAAQRRQESLGTADIALFAVESQTTNLGPRLPARLYAPPRPLSTMLAGDAQRIHLFLTIRPRQRVLDQYDITGIPLAQRSHVALLRCGTDAGIDLYDVTDLGPETLLTLDVPVIVSISMKSLADSTVRSPWSALLTRQSCTVLVDLRPSEHLRDWLTEAGTSLHYSFIDSETPTDTVRLFVFAIEDDSGNRSRTHLCVVPRLYAAGLRLWFAETAELNGRTHHDQRLADSLLVRITLAHLVTEERSFDFHAGESPR